jgi:hypothetical protein
MVTIPSSVDFTPSPASDTDTPVPPPSVPQIKSSFIGVGTIGAGGAIATNNPVEKWII